MTASQVKNYLPTPADQNDVAFGVTANGQDAAAGRGLRDFIQGWDPKL